MNRILHVIIILLCLFLLPHGTQAQQTVPNGATTQAIKMPGSACVYWWDADKPETGIQPYGIGNTVPAFVANNPGTTPITVTVSVRLPTGGADNTPVALIVSQLSGKVWARGLDANNYAYGAVSTQSEPYGIAITPDRSYVYITNRTKNTVSLIKYTVTNAVPPIDISHVLDIDVGTSPEGLVASPDGSKVYVVNSGDATISVISVADNVEVKKFPIGGALHPTGIAISPDGTTLYVSNNGSGTVTVINAADGQIKNNIIVGLGPQGIAISPDGKFVYVACQLANTISIINTASLAATPVSVPVGLKPFGVAVSPGSETVYVSNQGDNTVTAITTSNYQKKIFSVGASPRGIAVTPNGAFVYINNFDSNDVSKIEVATGQVTKFDQDGGPFSFGNFISGPSGCAIPPQPYTITITPTPPSITPSGSPAALSTGEGVTSASTSFSVSGLSLPQGILVTAPNGFEVSLDNENFAPTVTVGSAGNITSTPVYIRLKAADTQGTYPGTITFSSGSATATFAMTTGTVRPPEPTIITGNVNGSIFTCAGTPSASPNMLQTTVSAVNLNGVFGATASTGFEISLSQDKGFASHLDISYDANVPNTTIYVRSSTEIQQGTTNGIITYTAGPLSKKVAISAIAYFIPVAYPPTPLTQDVINLKQTVPIHFSGTGNTFNWVCDNPNINLPTSGVGDIPSFQAVNYGTEDVVAKITAWPVSAPLSYVANLGSNAVSVISINTNELIATIRVPAAPKYILISPDATRLYVSCYAADSVSVIDASLNKEIARIKVGSQPQGMSLNADGSVLSVFCSGGAGSVALIDTKTNKLINIVSAGRYPPGTVFSPDGKKAYAYNYGMAPNNFDVFDTETNKRIAPIPGHTSPQGLVLSPDGNTIYVTDATDLYPQPGWKHLLYVIDANTYEIKQTLNVGEYPQGIAITHDGKKLYVTSGLQNRVSVINTETFETEVDVEVGNVPVSIATTDGTGCEGVPVTCTIIVKPTPPTITAKGTPTGHNTIQGNPSDQDVFTVSGIKMQEGILVTPPNGFEVSLDGKTFAPTVTIPLTRTDGVITETTVYIRIAGVTKASTYSGDITMSSKNAENEPVTMPPVIVYEPTSTILASIAAGSINTCEGAPSASPNITQFTASGFKLVGDISVIAPDGFEVSLNADSGYGPGFTLAQSGGNVANTIIYIRSAASAKGTILGKVILKTPGATDGRVDVKANVGITPAVNKVTDKAYTGGMITDVFSFTGPVPYTYYSWANDNISIGLAKSGFGDIAAFTAVNKGNTPQLANITVTPITAPLAYVAMFDNKRLSIINTATGALVGAPINIGLSPTAVSASPDGKFVYVANQGDNSMSIINTNTNQEVLPRITGLQAPTGIVVSADGSKIYVANNSANYVTVIDATSHAPTTLPVGINPDGISLSPDGKLLYVVNGSSAFLSAINTSDQSTIKIPISGSGPKGIVISPDGTRIYITNYNSKSVTVIDATSNTQILPAIAVENNPRGIAINNDGSKLYVANAGSKSVSVIDTKTKAVTHIDVGNNPQGVSISPDGSLVYVANSGSSNISVIYTATNSVTTINNVGGSPVSFGNFITGGAGCTGPEMKFTITVNPESAYMTTSGTLPYFNTVYGTPSTVGSFKATGISLNGAITVVPPLGIELSTDNIKYSPQLTLNADAKGAVAATDIYVRLSATAAAKTYTPDDILLKSPGAADVKMPLTAVTKVDPAPLTITAKDVKKAVGTTLTGGPGSVKFDHTALQNNETVGTVTITYGAGAESSAAIDTYKGSVKPDFATGGTFSPDNYKIDYIPGDIIVSNIINADLIKIPNTFTPNGDGINDTWKIDYLLNFPTCTVNIYDRTGRSIFHSIGYGMPWDGTFAGQALPFGTYYYVIDIDKGAKRLSGYVLLVK